MVDFKLEDKPESMSIPDYLIRLTAKKLGYSEKMVDKVVTHQWKSAFEAVKENNEVLICGLGTFMFSKALGERRVKRYTNLLAAYNETPSDTPTLAKRIINAKSYLEKYTEKYNKKLQKIKSDEDRLERLARRNIKPDNSEQTSQGDS